MSTKLFYLRNWEHKIPSPHFPLHLTPPSGLVVLKGKKKEKREKRCL